MSYLVKEVFDTLQGEGVRQGTRAVFVRFAGCNLWSGDPDKRESGSGACAMWCDTDFTAKPTAAHEKYDRMAAFVAPRRLTALELVGEVAALWPQPTNPGCTGWVVLTGGEPLLQADGELVRALNHAGFLVAVETSGTVEPRAMFDWLAVSPKLRHDGEVLELKVTGADELKVVLPGHIAPERGWTAEKLMVVASVGNWAIKMVQPADPILTSLLGQSQLVGGCLAKDDYDANVRQCVEWVKAHPDWRMTMQMHKLAGLR